MAGNGPAAKDPATRRRRNAAVGKTLLPASGRAGEAPVWPIATAGEPAVWAELWRTPQAVAWERHALTRVVARYARMLDRVEADPEGGSMAMNAEIRQLEDRLGLNAKSMRALLWEVTDAEIQGAAATEGSSAPTGRADEMRAKLRIVG